MARWWRDLISEEPIPEEIPYEGWDVWELIKAGKFKNKTEQQIMDYGRKIAEYAPKITDYKYGLPAELTDPHKPLLGSLFQVSSPLSYMTSGLARSANATAKAIGLTREDLKPYIKVISYLWAGAEGRKSFASYEEQLAEDIKSWDGGYSGISFHKEEYEKMIKEGRVAEVPESYFDYLAAADRPKFQKAWAEKKLQEEAIDRKSVV